MNLRVTVSKGIRRMPDDYLLRRAQMAWATKISGVAWQAVQDNAPHDKGMLAGHLSQTRNGIEGTGTGYAVRMGYIGSLRIKRSAPKNTIRQFLNWYRHARKSKPSVSKPFPTAWYILSPIEKKVLDVARTSSNFGGPQPPPTYMAAVNEGKVPLPPGTSAYSKAMRNKGFVERIQKDVLDARGDAINEARKALA